jgi:hypothetical protein
MKRRSFLQSLFALAVTPVVAETIQPKVPVVENVVRNGVGDYTINYTWVKPNHSFDIVAYTGDGSSERILSHSLGFRPAGVLIKNRSAPSEWKFYHAEEFETVPLQHNEPGNNYVAYKFSADAVDKIEPHVKEMYGIR